MTMYIIMYKIYLLPNYIVSYFARCRTGVSIRGVVSQDCSNIRNVAGIVNVQVGGSATTKFFKVPKTIITAYV